MVLVLVVVVAVAVVEAKNLNSSEKKAEIDRIIDEQIKDLPIEEVRETIEDIQSSKCQNWLKKHM